MGNGEKHPQILPNLPWCPLTKSYDHCITTPWCTGDTTHIGETSDIPNTVLPSPDNHWQFSDNPLTFPNAPNPPWCHLTSLDNSKRLQNGVGVVRGSVEGKSEGRLQSFRWVGQRVVVLSGALECFPPITLSISPPMMTPLSFFDVAGCPQKLCKSKCPSVTVILPYFEALNDILELRYRFLKNGSCNWTPCSIS